VIIGKIIFQGTANLDKLLNYTIWL